METEKQIRERVRNFYRARRDAMPPELVKQRSEEISRAVLQWDAYRQAEALFFYYPLGNEVSLLPVIADALERGRPAAFPKVSGFRMEFYQVTSLDELAEGCFHVMEPKNTAGPPADWADVLCFVPGTAFDRRGGRFGYGRGYYDRCFAGSKGRRLAGCAYECQIGEALPVNAWDRKMDYLISELGIFKI